MVIKNTLCAPEQAESFQLETRVGAGLYLITAYNTKGPRESNMDALSLTYDMDLDCLIGVVCDGMGGHPGSEDLSRELPEWMSQLIYRGCQNVIDNSFTYSNEDICRSAVKALVDIIRTEVLDPLLQNTSYQYWGPRSQVGSTMTGFLLWREVLCVFNIGDSTTHILFEDESEFETEPHGYGNQLWQFVDERFHPSSRAISKVDYTTIDLTEQGIQSMISATDGVDDGGRVALLNDPDLTASTIAVFNEPHDNRAAILIRRVD